MFAFVRPYLVWIALGCLGLPVASHAEGTVSELTPTDARQLEYQRKAIQDMAALHLGRRVTGDRTRDIELLQLLLDRRIVKAGETRDLQSMGVVLGDLLAAELDMEWVIFEDRYGRSKALQLGPSMNFLFPITMISRRVDAGLGVNINEVYQKAIKEMEPYIMTRYRRRGYDD